MPVFAYDVLVVAVLAACLYFYTKWQKSEVGKRLTVVARRYRRRIAGLETDIADLKQAIDRQGSVITLLDAKLRTNFGVPAPSAANPWTKQEERAVREYHESRKTAAVGE